jgi:hypothetical protein
MKLGLCHAEGRIQIKGVENWGLRRIFGLTREDMAGGWRRLHNEELHKLYASQNMVSVIKSKSITWTGNVARMTEVHTHILSENLKGRHRMEDLGVDGNIILEFIYLK